jgi:predicted PurR-regulated permease PerM
MGKIRVKLKFDMKYLKVAAYVAGTLTATYILFKVVDSAAFIVTNLEKITTGAGRVLGRFFSIFSVLITSFVIAYVLDPTVEFFQKKYDAYAPGVKAAAVRTFKIPALRRGKGKKSPGDAYARRTGGAAITYAVIAAVLGALIAFFASRISSSAGGLSQGIASMVNSTIVKLSDFLTGARIAIEGWGAGDYFSDALSAVINSVGDTIRQSSGGLIGAVASAGGFALNFFISLAVAFYFLRDKWRIVAGLNDFIDSFLPEKWRPRLRNAASDVHAVFSGYIRGQMTDALIMGVLLSVGLSVVGIELAVPIGIFSGLANIIPYFGAIVGFVISVSAALLAGDLTKAAAAAIVVLILQQIDGLFIVPKVVGEKVEMSPALVLLSLSVFGSMFGVWGMVFAVPSCAVLKIVFNRLSRRRKQDEP